MASSVNNFNPDELMFHLELPDNKPDNKNIKSINHDNDQIDDGFREGDLQSLFDEALTPLRSILKYNTNRINNKKVSFFENNEVRTYDADCYNQKTYHEMGKFLGKQVQEQTKTGMSPLSFIIDLINEKKADLDNVNKLIVSKEQSKNSDNIFGIQLKNTSDLNLGLGFRAALSSHYKAGMGHYMNNTNNVMQYNNLNTGCSETVAELEKKREILQYGLEILDQMRLKYQLT